MPELSIMCDESGEWGKLSEYYLITLVFHDQGIPLATHIARYEEHLRDAALPNVPFHAGPLLNGHDDYESMSLAGRKRLLFAFFTLARNLPFTYVTFAHRKSEFNDDKRRFEAQLRRDLADYLLSHLDRFQSYEIVKVYYDNGQQIVTDALRASIGYALSKEAIIYRETSPKDYRLEQACDLLCTMEPPRSNTRPRRKQQPTAKCSVRHETSRKITSRYCAKNRKCSKEYLRSSSFQKAETACLCSS